MPIQTLRQPGWNARTRLLMALVLLFTALAAGVLLWQAERSRAQLREQVMLQAEQRSLHLADAMAGQVGALLSMLDLELLDLRREWLRDPVLFDPIARAVIGALPSGFVTHTSVVGADGYVRYNSLGEENVTYVGDREHFLAAKGAGDRMRIGKPVASRLVDDWIFAVSRPIFLDGEFDGVIHMMVSTQRLSEKLAALQLSEQDVVALTHPDGTFMARSRGNLEAVRGPMPDGRPHVLERGSDRGIYRVVDAVDRTARTYGWRRVEPYGLVVAIGLADASVLAPLAPAFDRGRLVTATLTALLILCGGLVSALLLRVARNQAVVAANEAFRVRQFESSMVPTVVMDARTATVIDCNPAAWRIYGFPDRASVLGGTPAVFSAPLQYDGTPSADKGRVYIKQAIRDGSVVFEWLHQRPDGTRWDGEVRLMCFESAGRLLLQFTLQDITEMRVAQAALRRLNEELEQRVTERTREMAKLNRDLEAFAYSVSHDLRTPLRSIDGYANLLDAEFGEQIGEDARSYLERIQRAAGRMGSLISDMLTMANINRAEPRRQTVDLSELAHSVIAEITGGETGRAAEWRIEDGLFAQADPGLLRAVLQNLLGNAWKYTGQVPQARIGFSRHVRADGAAEFCVSDNGAGFDMAYAGKLFEPFKRLHAHHEFEGTGVGLATVHRIIERHGGQVRGEGAVGQGARFFFTLPDAPG